MMSVIFTSLVKTSSDLSYYSRLSSWQLTGRSFSTMSHLHSLYLDHSGVVLLADLERYLEILLTSNRIPEAAFFARTYLPSEISRVVEMWRMHLGKVTEKAGQSLSDPKVGI